MAAGAIRVGGVRERAGAGGKRFYLDFGRRAPRTAREIQKNFNPAAPSRDWKARRRDHDPAGAEYQMGDVQARS